jgi:hypothetical protein
MSLFKIDENNISVFSIISNAERHYISSSSGITGSLTLHNVRSRIIKEESVNSSGVFNDSGDENAINSILNNAIFQRTYGETVDDSYIQLFNDSISGYMDAVDLLSSQGESPDQPLDVEITEDDDELILSWNEPDYSIEPSKKINRIVPASIFDNSHMKKHIVKDMLSAYYRSTYPDCNWGYTNFNCLNFFTSSKVPSDSVIMYPNVIDEYTEIVSGKTSGSYCINDEFSFDFWIKPSYNSLSNNHFNPGTIFHLSSSYAVSLTSGSLKNEFGEPLAFNIKLQLSHSADQHPTAVEGAYPRDLIFQTIDNSLKYNEWNHVVIRWGTNINNQTGSFIINGEKNSEFTIPSSSICPDIFASNGPPDVLFIGNFFEGPNSSSSYRTSRFFSKTASQRYGLVELNPVQLTTQPFSPIFRHQLNAEVHNLCIKTYYTPDEEISGKIKTDYQDRENVKFYLPPFFIESSPIQKFTSGVGGILQTPYHQMDGSSIDPFNTSLSFGVGAHYINIENYLKDFSTGNYAHCFSMYYTPLSYTDDAYDSNELLYQNQDIRRRNTLIMPCDNGLFTQDYSLLVNENVSHFTESSGYINYSSINLDNLLSDESFVFQTSYNTENDIQDDYIESLIGFSPEYPGKQPGLLFTKFQQEVEDSISSNDYDYQIHRKTPLPIFQRTRDSSSNQVTIFDISSMFYGMKIKPSSIVLKDNAISGSGDAFGVTLKDNGIGNLYRADSISKHASNASCGNVYYDEGIIVITNPHLYFFGKEQFELSFEAFHKTHVMKIDVIARQGSLNTSSNTTFSNIENTDSYIESKYVYVTNVNFHDENLNIVAKTQLSQPIVKRYSDRMLFRTAIDF